MKRMEKTLMLLLVFYTFITTGNAFPQEANPCKTGGKTNYFGIEMKNILCGYSVETYCTGMWNDKKVLYEYSDVVLKMSLLGSDVDGGFKTLYLIDPKTERAVMIDISVINNQSYVIINTRIDGDTIHFRSSNTGTEKVLLAGDDVMISSPTRYPYLLEDFIKGGANEKKYKVFDPMKGEITEKLYTRKPDENISLRDTVYKTTVLDEADLTTGVKTTLWLRKSDGYNVRANIAGRQHIYLADKSVSSRIIQANLDDLLFVKVNKTIPEMMNLTYVKVKAQINSYGENITSESLNYPGQKFTGTVVNNLIDGEFEVQPVRYNGLNAPPFPPDYSHNTMLKKYLESELTIESDDPLIISEAGRITKGSKDSWEAAVRLSKWVSENIAGAVPGGISAINTLKTQEAECGGHSRLLAAFCRALGIPARLSIGCVYTLNYTGSFGQHAWTEVYMGDAGWIPVDATFGETSYIDASHIRLGENANFRPVKMELLDYTLITKENKNSLLDSYAGLLGNYINLEQYRMFSIIKKDDVFAIKIPGRFVLDLNPPDDKGIWYPILTSEIGLLPIISPDGKTDKIVMYQHYRLKKMSAPDSGNTDLPEEYRKFYGNYQFAPVKLSVDVMFDKNEMTTQEPLGKSKERISYTKTGDAWIDKRGNYEISFVTNIENEITALLLTTKTEFIRGEPVTNVLEKVLKESGTDAMIDKYTELKGSKNSGYVFSVHMLHQIGGNLFRENKIDDALKVYLLNYKEYPDSFITNDALAETYLKMGEKKAALKFFKKSVELMPDYEYGKKMIEELKK
jgi:transglutaminase-like putative cysteine protease